MISLSLSFSLKFSIDSDYASIFSLMLLYTRGQPHERGGLIISISSEHFIFRGEEIFVWISHFYWRQSIFQLFRFDCSNQYRYQDPLNKALLVSIDLERIPHKSTCSRTVLVRKDKESRENCQRALFYLLGLEPRSRSPITASTHVVSGAGNLP